MNKYFHIVFATIILTISNPAPTNAQSTDHWHTFGVTNGLASSKVSAMTRDQKGYLWFATLGGGVSRYDGEHWETFTTTDGIANNWVHHIYQDHAGNLWFATNNGVSKFDGKNWNAFNTKNGLTDNTVYAITQDKNNNLWFATNNGVSKFDGKNWNTFNTKNGLTDNTVYAITQDKNNNLWFATNNGVSKFDGKNWNTFNTKNGLAHNDVRSILQDREGHLWFGTNGGGVSRFDGKHWTTLTTQNGLTHNWVIAIYQDPEGHLWFGSDGGGVSRYSNTFHTFTAKDGLASNVIVSGFKDREGHLWFGSDGGGVSRLNLKTNTWKTFTTQDGLIGDRIRSILQDRNGNLWFGVTDGGISRYDGKTFTSFTTKDGLAQNHIYSAFLDQQDWLWVGTGSFDISGQGVSRYNGQEWQTFTTKDGLADNTVFSISQDHTGNLWFGTLNGLSRYDGKNVRIFTTEDGLVHNHVRAIYQDRDHNLWFGTEQGISRYDGKTFTNLTTKDGLIDNQIRSIYQDKNGTMWFGTLGGGVTRYDGQVLQNMTVEDGLAGNGIYTILQDDNGAMWFGTLGGGVTRYTPPSPAHPPIFIDAIVAGRRYENQPNLRVPSSVGLIAFEFHGISFKTRPNAMRYRYKLKGYQNEWHITQNQRVEFQDLPTGTYTFAVQAIDRDLVYSAQIDSVKLEVYYQPMSSSVQIDQLNIQDIFASYYKTYSEYSIGDMQVSNSDPNPIEATVSFFIPDFMKRPTEQIITLNPQSNQTIPLHAIFDPTLLNLNSNTSAQAEVALSCKINNHTIAVKKLVKTNLFERNTLTWDDLGRAAAFVTPSSPQVTRFAHNLYENYRHQIKKSPSQGNIPTAMLIFEALNAHGIKYVQDASSPYSQARANRSALDNIQYPGELLQSKLGDCDDCTVLYCSLLENLNIPTAFIDYPAHILMMFDSGVTARHAFGFQMDESRYILRDGRFWIPIEVTKLGEGSFMEAWDLGLQICDRLTEQGELKITDVRTAWQRYPYAQPTIEGEWELPNPEVLERLFQDNLRKYQDMRSEYVNRKYIHPLLKNPHDHIRRIEFVQTKIETQNFNDAIVFAIPLLETEHRAQAYALIGCAYAGQKDIPSAVQAFEKALEHAPNNLDYTQNLDLLKKALSKTSQ